MQVETFPTRLTEGLWVLGNYYFDLYLVQGRQGSALIEVGVSGVIDDVIKQLDSLKIRPTFIVVTHPHADHITGLPALMERFPQALVVAGEGAPDFLAHPKAADSILPEDRHMSEFLSAHGIEPGRPPLQDPPSLQNCLVAKDGDEMDLGDVTLRFLSIKGHSPGKIVVHIPELDALILSDSLGFRYPGRGIFPLFLTGFSDYTSGLDRLEALGAKIVGVAHQGPLVGDEPAEAFKEARQEAVLLKNKILDDHRDKDEIIREIFERYYVDECTMYTRENIMTCARLLVKRALQETDEG